METEDQFQSLRVHSLNSLLKDQVYHRREHYGLKRFARIGSKIFNPWNEPSLRDEESVNEAGSYENGPVSVLPKAQLTSKRLSSVHLANRRILVIWLPSSKTSLAGVLQRLCGGPLEKLVYYNKRECLEVHFVHPMHAHNFYDYSQTGLFIYNGKKLAVEWANETNTENTSLIHPPVPKHLLALIQCGARRSLLFLKKIPKETQKDLHYPDPKANYCQDFNIRCAVDALSVMANVVEFSPVVSTKMAFSVQFDDIRSALNVKKQCQTKGTLLNDMFHDWLIHFGKDVTEKPCLKV